MLRVRSSVWLVFLVVLGLAVALPLADLWRMSQLPLVAQVRLEATSYVVEAPMRLVVIVPDGSSSLVEHTPLVIRMEMAEMPMGTQSVAVPPQPQAQQYQAPLRFSMAGTWHVQLHLSVPDHAPWSQELTVQIVDGAGTPPAAH